MSLTNINASIPATTEDLLKRRQNGGLTLNDAVDIVFAANISDKELRAHISSVTDDTSPTGKCSLDTTVAAMRIMELAEGNPAFVDRKLVDVQRALNVVLKRYKLSRSQRIAALNGPRASKPSSASEAFAPTFEPVFTSYGIAAE